MAYTLPTWLSFDVVALREQSGLTPDQLTAVADDAAMETVITGHIDSQAKHVLGKARLAAGARSFPSTDAELEVAYPVVVEFPVIVPYDASSSEKASAQRDVREAAHELSIPAPITLKFPLVVGNPDDQIDPTQDAINAAAEAGEESRANRIEEQQELVRTTITSFIFAKLWYSATNPGTDYITIADGHWKTAQSLLTSLVKNVAEVKARYALARSPFV